MQKYVIAMCCLISFLLAADLFPAEKDKLNIHEQEWKKLNTTIIQAYRQGRYQQAVVLAEKAYHYALNHLSKTHPDTLTSINNLAALYYSQGRYGEAEPLYKEARQLCEKALGREHPKTLIPINNLALLYDSQGRYGEAETLYQEVLQVREKVLGRDHPDTLTSINNLAALYYYQGRYGEAELLYNEALQVRKKVLGREHPDTLTSINNLATLYKSQGRYGEAEPLFNEALQVREKALGREHPKTLISINNLAALYKSQGRYGEAETLYQEVLQLREKALGREHPDTLTSINNLAALYDSQGRYGEAEPLYREALQVREKALGREHPDTLTSINNLATLYKSQGRYGEAETLYKEALQIRKKALGREHPRTLISINNLALLYYYQGRYGEAEPLYKEARQLCEKVLGREHPKTLISINNLALLYDSQGRYGEAEPLYREVLQVRKKALGREHPDTLTSINNLAALYKSQGRYGEAEPLYQEALQVRKKALGREHPRTLTSINNLAALYYYQGRYGEAEPLYKEALQLREKVLGRDHPDTLTTQMNAIVLMISMGKTRSGFRHLKTFENNLFHRSFQELYTTATERVRRLYLENIATFQDVTFSFARQHQKSEYQQFAADVLLRWKQVYTEENAFQHRLLATSHDPDIIKLKQKIDVFQTEFSRKIRHAKDINEVRNIWQNLNQAEKTLRKRTRAFKSDLQVSRTNLDQIMAQLSKDSALIEYRIFRPLNFITGKPENLHMGAYLLLGDINNDRQIFFEDMGEVKTLYDTSFNKPEKQKTLYQALLGKFDEQIKNLKKIYIAPDGFLHLISFAALRLPDGKYLVQRNQVNRLQTGRDLLTSSTQKPDNFLLAIGGVNYGKKALKTVVPDTDLPKHYTLRTAQELKDNFVYLEDSLSEAENIARIFRDKCKGGKTAVYKAKDATEGCLKNLGRAPRIMHFSTHGFFLENTHKHQEWAEQESPLLLSGLALGGANNGLMGMVDQNGDDGLLYSMEVLGLNLQGTELVSLSACKTGQGVLDYSEGVYGLVQAFRIAGAQSVLMTLRPVGDRSSREFMETFYENWLGAKDSPTPSTALHRTRLVFINHQINKAYRDPAIWSPYVMVGF